MNDRFHATLWAILIGLTALGLGACGGPPNMEGYFLYSADASADGPAGIYIATANGKNATPLLPDAEALSPRWDAAGRRIYYTTDFGGGREVAAYDLTSNRIVPITDHQPILAAEFEAEQARKAADEARLPANPFHFKRPGPEFVRFDLAFPSPTPDGKYVAWAVLVRLTDFAPVYRGTVYAAPVDGGRPHRIGADLSAPDWGPGGYVAVAGGSGRIVKHDFGADPTTGEIDPAADRVYADRSGQGTIQGARLSPDGTRAAWVQGQGVLVAAVDGSERATVLATRKNFMLPAPGVRPMYVAWSPDGRYVAVLAGLERRYKRGGILVFRADGQPIFKNSVWFRVKGITGRVDAFDWVATIE